MIEIFSVLSSIFHPQRTFQHYRERVVKMTPYQKWKLIRDLVDILCNVMGIKVMSDCSRSWLTIMPPVVGSTSIIIQVYSLWFYWDLNMISALQPLALLALAVPVRITVNRTH